MDDVATSVTQSRFCSSSPLFTHQMIDSSAKLDMIDLIQFPTHLFVLQTLVEH